WAMTSPKEFLWKVFVDGFKYVAFDLAWGYFKRNLWYFLGVLVLKAIAYKAYRMYMNKRNAEGIFKTVKDRLRTLYDANRHLEGITEEEIVREYSKDYTMDEDYFRRNIMPRLKDLRR